MTRFHPADPTLAWREILTVDVPGAPIGAQRPRVVRLKNGHSHTFMPDKAVAQEVRLMLAARDAWHGRAALDELVRVDVIAVVERPNKYVPRRYQGALTKPGEQRMLTAGFDALGRLPCPTKPDLDNVVKLAWDALVKAEVLTDDTRVVESTCSKWWTAIGEGPSTRVVVSVGMGGRWW